MEFILWIAITFISAGILFGVVYPAFWIFTHKVIKNDTRSIIDIYKEL